MQSIKLRFTLTIVIALLIAVAPSAAVTGYKVYGTGGAGLKARTGPGTSYTVVRVLAEGTPLDINCQDYGSDVGGSRIWDRLQDGTWVSDYYVYCTPYAQFDTRIP